MRTNRRSAAATQLAEVPRCLGQIVSPSGSVLGWCRGSQRYARRCGADEAQLLEEMRRIARQRPRFRTPRIHDTLQWGWDVNHKSVERLWRQEEMQVPRRQ